jgi:hypothetical protein
VSASAGWFPLVGLAVRNESALVPLCLADGADLGLLLGAWGGEAQPADLNVDGTIDGADLGLLLGAWGDCPD